MAEPVGHVVAAEGKRLVVGTEGEYITLGPSSYTEPIWCLAQDRAGEFAQLLVRACWLAGRTEATMPP